MDRWTGENMIKRGDAITSMRSVAGGFSYVMDLVNSEVEDHHKKVAYLAFRLAQEMHLPEHACRLSIIGGLLHDIGGVLEKGKISLMDLEANAIELADAGASIVRLIPVNAPLADITRYSQRPAQELLELTRGYGSLEEWMKKMEGLKEEEKRRYLSRMIGQIVHLSDVAVLMFDGSDSPLNRVVRLKEGIQRIVRGEGCTEGEEEQKQGECCRGIRVNHFHPWVVEAFERLCTKEVVWLDLAYEPDAFLEFIPNDEVVTLEKMELLAEFASVIIDFRSPFTARHSAGVSASAVELAKLLHMTEGECIMMKIAGNLHDIGKLKIPTEILEKPGKLTDEEFNIIKEHPYFTWKILKHIEGLDTIMDWAVHHHEKLSGRGYPFHLTGEHLSLGARVLAVADIFSAITEDRPYRAGMEKDKALGILRGDAARGDIDENIVELLASHYDQVNEARRRASEIAGERYHGVRQRYGM